MSHRSLAFLTIISLIFTYFALPECPAEAEELTLKLNVIGPEGATPFNPQLRVVVTNESFTSAPLWEKMRSSELVVDGHSYKKAADSFQGPGGLPAKGSWEGCFTLDDYAAQDVAPGTHSFQWRLGDALTEKIRFKIPKRAPAASTGKARLGQAEALKKALGSGLLKSCVENWLTEKDGGLASAGEVRYYVDPGVKVLVPYDPSGPDPRVHGAVRIYRESKVAD
jgi:hypothetical protein